MNQSLMTGPCATYLLLYIKDGQINVCMHAIKEPFFNGLVLLHLEH